MQSQSPIKVFISDKQNPVDNLWPEDTKKLFCFIFKNLLY